MCRAKEAASEILVPRQLGIGVSNPGEAISQAMHSILAARGDTDTIALLKIDFENAFNLISRSAILKAVANPLPELYNYARLCYGPIVQPHLWYRQLRLRSVCGVQQGDPLGPFFFALGLHDFLSESADDVAREGELLENYFLDDGFAIGEHAYLRSQLSRLSSPTAKAFGLYLRIDKCKV